MYQKRHERLRFLFELFQTGNRWTFKQLNDKIESEFGWPLNVRQLRKDLSHLRYVGFENKPINIRVEEMEYFLSNDYRFRIENLTETEKATLPFLLGLLKPYTEIPAVGALVRNIVDVHHLNRSEVNTDVLVLSQLGQSLQNIQVDVMNRILNFIYLQQAIEFIYVKVAEGANMELASDNHKTYSIYPLQIKESQGRFFLIAIKVGNEPRIETIQTFALDRIIKGPDPFYEFDDDSEPLNFDWEVYFRKSELKEYFEHCMGIIRNHKTDTQPKNVERWFNGWAASEIQAVPLHSSQQVREVRVDGSVKIRWIVYDNDEVKGILAKYGEYCWEE